MRNESITARVRQDLRPVPLMPKFAEIKAFKAASEHLAEALERAENRISELEAKLADD